jgi:GTP cyclohydrolase III
MSSSITQTTDPALFKSFQAAYDTYVQAIDGVGKETARRVAEAQQRYMQQGTEAASDPADAMKRAHSAMQEYALAVKAAWDDSQAGYSQAYARFLEDHRSAWNSADLPSLTPAIVAMVSASVNLVTSYANATIGDWGTIAYAGVSPATLTTASNSRAA